MSLRHVLFCFCAMLLAIGPATAQVADKVAKEDLRYDGKDFAYWKNYWRTELKAERRIEAVRALGAFGVNGYGEEAARMIVELLQGYREVDFGVEYRNAVEYRNGEFHLTAEQRLVQTSLENLDKLGTPVYAALAENLTKPRMDKVIEDFFHRSGRRFQSPPSEAFPLFTMMLADERAEIRDVVFWCLYHNCKEERVKKALATPKFANLVFHAALESVLTNKGAGDYLLKKLGPSAAPLTDSFVKALQDLKSKRDKAVAAPKEIDETIKERFLTIATVLEAIGPKAREAIPVLNEWSRDVSPEVQAAAQAAIESIRKGAK